MALHKSLAIVFCVIMASMVVLPAARADEWNQMTKVTFNEAVEIPGAALPAGAYWFVISDNQVDRQTVCIFSSDWSKIIARLHTIPVQRTESTDDTEIRFAERLHSQPEAVLDWYYPGLLLGHEFMYPTKEERELTRDAKQDVVAQPFNLVSPGA